jgi:NAD(P)-dependent dehydrogenase (short-subunit alcohol dehydrogenase family)
MTSRSPCIVVTGASRGIGAHAALALAADGHTVACLSRSGGLPTADAAMTARLVGVACDVTRPGAMKIALGDVAARGHTITGLVNNAGVHLDAPSATASLEHYDTVMATNATSVLLGCQAVHSHLVAAGGGLILNMGSFFDKLGVKRNLAYCASKAAVAAMTRCLAVEWAGDGIRVLTLAPGYIHTDLNHDAMAEGGPLRTYLDKRIPGRQPGTAAEVGRFIAALFTLDARFLTGETIYLDGGQGIAH